MTIETDDFNRADENPLSDDGNWTVGQGTWDDIELVSNQIKAIPPGPPPRGAARRSGFIPRDDQFSEHEFIFNTPAAGESLDSGPFVRMADGTDESAYLFKYDEDESGPTKYAFYRIDPGRVFVQLGAAIDPSVSPFSSGDKLKLEIIATVLEGFHNGTSLGTRSDSTLATGHPGIFIFDGTAAGSVRVDNWEGGSLGLAAQIGLVGTVSKALNDIRDYVHPSEWAEAANATNAVATATKSGVSGKAHLLTTVFVDYSGTGDVTGTVTIVGIASGSIVLNVRNQRELTFSHPSRSSEATDITVQLSAGGVGVVGRVAIMGYTIG